MPWYQAPSGASHKAAPRRGLPIPGQASTVAPGTPTPPPGPPSVVAGLQPPGSAAAASGSGGRRARGCWRGAGGAPGGGGGGWRGNGCTRPLWALPALLRRTVLEAVTRAASPKCSVRASSLPPPCGPTKQPVISLSLSLSLSLSGFSTPGKLPALPLLPGCMLPLSTVSGRPVTMFSIPPLHPMQSHTCWSAQLMQSKAGPGGKGRGGAPEGVSVLSEPRRGAHQVQCLHGRVPSTPFRLSGPVSRSVLPTHLPLPLNTGSISPLPLPFIPGLSLTLLPQLWPCILACPRGQCTPQEDTVHPSSGPVSRCVTPPTPLPHILVFWSGPEGLPSPAPCAPGSPAGSPLPLSLCFPWAPFLRPSPTLLSLLPCVQTECQEQLPARHPQGQRGRHLRRGLVQAPGKIRLDTSGVGCPSPLKSRTESLCRRGRVGAPLLSPWCQASGSAVFSPGSE